MLAQDNHNYNEAHPQYYLDYGEAHPEYYRVLGCPLLMASSPSHRWVCVSCCHEIDMISRERLGKVGPPWVGGTWIWGRCEACRPCRTLRHRLKCVECSKAGYEESQLLLDEGGVMASWVGRTWARCFTCSNFDDMTKFEQTVQVRWAQHDEADVARPASLRIQTCCDALTVLEKLFPGASQRDLRMLTLKRREAAAMAMALALDQESEMCGRAADHAAKRYLGEIRAAAANTTYKASSDGMTITNQETEYLTKVAQGVTFVLYLTCSGCGLVAMRSKWTQWHDCSPFRCPRCNQPHDIAIGLRQRMLKMTDPNSGLSFEFPVMWPDWINNKRPEDGWLHKMVTAKAAHIQTGEKLDAFVQKSVVSLSDLLAKVAMASGFKAVVPSGFRLQGEDRYMRRFDDWPELIDVLASLVAGANALGCSLKGCLAATSCGR